MIGIAVDKAKSFILDVPKILEAEKEAERRILGYQGGKLRKIIQKSMRSAPRKQPVAIQGKKRRGRKSARPPVSPPGSPPYTHTKFLKNAIVYQVEEQNHLVVVGPLKRSAKYEGIPSILERGGTETQKRRSIFGKPTTKTVTYKPRPYMAPALKAITPTLPKDWSGAINKPGG